MGGYASLPGALAGRLLGLPLLIHEQNAVPGMANRVLARLATRVLEAFPGSFAPAVGARVVGNPLRPEIAALPPPAARPVERTVDHVLVLGGSQGALALNRTVPAALGRIGGRRLEIRHQCGERHLETTRAAYRDAGLDVSPIAFVEDMAAAYGWADVVVCRAGAMTVSELAAAGVASVLVPFPHAVDDHQTRNARFLADAGAAVLMPESALAPEALATTLSELLDDRDRLSAMARAARALARPDATEHVARQCLEVADG